MSHSGRNPILLFLLFLLPGMAMATPDFVPDNLYFDINRQELRLVVRNQGTSNPGGVLTSSVCNISVANPTCDSAVEMSAPNPSDTNDAEVRRNVTQTLSPGTYTLQVSTDSRFRFSESSEFNNHRQFVVTIPVVDSVDYTVESMAMDYSDDELDITFRNDGDGVRTELIAWQVYVDGVPYGPLRTFSAQLLQSGGTHSVQLDASLIRTFAGSDSADIRVVIDADDAYLESDEGNNELHQNVELLPPPPPALPDLVIVETVYKAPFIYVSVENQGAGDAPSSLLLAYTNGLKDAAFQTNAIASGSKYWHKIHESELSLNDGEINTLFFRTDYVNNIEEEDESNNIGTLGIDLINSTPSPLMDLYVHDIREMFGYIIVDVRNVSGDFAHDPLGIRLAVGASGGTSIQLDLRFVAPGYTTFFFSREDLEIDDQTFSTISAIIDQTNRIHEFNENNNLRKEKIFFF